MENLDNKTLKRKYLIAILSSPLTLSPVAGGLTLGALSLVLGSPLLALVSFVGGCGFGVTIFLQRLVQRPEKLVKQILDEVQQEEQQRIEAELDELYEKLQRTTGKKDEDLLASLRALVNAFELDSSWQKNINSGSAGEIIATVHRIFSECIRALEENYDCWAKSKEAGSEDVAQTFKRKREKILMGVEQSLGSLKRTLESLHGVSEDSPQVNIESSVQLTGLGKELAQQLEDAKKVQASMKSFDINRLPEKLMKEYENYSQNP